MNNISFLARGFRPFFFVGALFSFLMIFIWGLEYAGYVSMPNFIENKIFWHAHEMVFGYAVAIIAGFLLTAVANWTGGAPVRQYHLLALVILWTLGRIFFSFQINVPNILSYILILSFIPALALSLAIPLLKSWNKRNLIFLILLFTLFALDCWAIMTGELKPIYLAIFIIIIMISLIGGRIIPAFTVAGLRRKGIEIYQKDQPKTDIFAILSLILVFIAFALEIKIAITTTAVISAIIHIVRIKNYHTALAFKEPMLWILHLGFIWLILGLLMLALYGLNFISLSLAIHSLTAGAISTMIIGMICRVAMGHTGREIKANLATIVIFILIQLAAIIRVFLPAVMPEFNIQFITISAFIWAFCYFVYLLNYSHMLFLPRPDGRPA